MATNAVQRLVATKVRAHSIEIPKFRYVDDVTRFLDSMRPDIEEAEGLIDAQQTALAHLRRPRQWVGAAMDKIVLSDRKKIEPELKKVVIPNLDKLKNQYGLSEDLYERYRTLEAVGSQLALQFPDRKGEAYERAQGTLRELKKKVAEQMRRVLKFLEEVADAHVPKAFDKYRQAIAQTVQEHIQFENAQQFLYVSIDNQNLMFTSYLMLIDCVDDDGHKIPHLYISLQWVVGDCVYAQINHEFELPNQLVREPGTECHTTIEAIATIQTMLNAEGFSSSLGQREINQ